MLFAPEAFLAARAHRLAPATLLCGDEPLQTFECLDALRERARAAGFAERVTLTAERGFDWGSLTAASQTMSLFSSRQMIELRLPTGKPGEEGTHAISRLLAAANPDVLLVVLSGKLDRTQRAAAWVSAIERVGDVIEAREVPIGRLSAWVTARLKRHALTVEAGVVERIVTLTEGNLLATAQETDKLAYLAEAGRVSLAQVEASLAESARFTVFQWVDCLLKGEVQAAQRILTSLRAEGEEPILPLVMLVRELRSLVAIAADMAAGQPVASVMQKYRVWDSRKSAVQTVLRRHDLARLRDLLALAADADAVLKGQRRGAPWTTLERLALAVASQISIQRLQQELLI